MDRFDIVTDDLVDRPGGLLLFRSFKNDGSGMSPGDILLLSSIVPDDEQDIELAENARSRGAFIVTISPEGALSRSADRAIISGNDGLNGVIPVTGIETRFCPISGIANVTLAWALAARITESLLKRGITPSAFYGEYLAGLQGKNRESRKRYLSNRY